MSRSRAQRGMPAAVAVAAVLLSMSTAADASLAAVLLGAGRAAPVQRTGHRQALGQWLDRLTDAARQVRNVLRGRVRADVTDAAVGMASNVEPVAAPQCVGVVPVDRWTAPGVAPLRPMLTDLPPPVV